MPFLVAPMQIDVRDRLPGGGFGRFGGMAGQRMRMEVQEQGLFQRDLPRELVLRLQRDLPLVPVRECCQTDHQLVLELLLLLCSNEWNEMI